MKEDERGLNFDRNAKILLKSHFPNQMNMRTHFWLLLVLRYIEVVCSASLPLIIIFYADQCQPNTGLVWKAKQDLASVQINRQQDAQRRKNFVRARLVTLVSQSKHGEKCF